MHHLYDHIDVLHVPQYPTHRSHVCSVLCISRWIALKYSTQCCHHRFCCSSGSNPVCVNRKSTINESSYSKLEHRICSRKRSEYNFPYKIANFKKFQTFFTLLNKFLHWPWRIMYNDNIPYKLKLLAWKPHRLFSQQLLVFGQLPHVLYCHRNELTYLVSWVRLLQQANTIFVFRKSISTLNWLKEFYCLWLKLSGVYDKLTSANLLSCLQSITNDTSCICLITHAYDGIHNMCVNTMPYGDDYAHRLYIPDMYVFFSIISLAPNKSSSKFDTFRRYVTCLNNNFCSSIEEEGIRVQVSAR